MQPVTLYLSLFPWKNCFPPRFMLFLEQKKIETFNYVFFYFLPFFEDDHAKKCQQRGCGLNYIFSLFLENCFSFHITSYWRRTLQTSGNVILYIDSY